MTGKKNAIIDQFDRLQTIGRDPLSPEAPQTLSIASMNYRTIIRLSAEFYNLFPAGSIRLIVHEFDRDGVMNSVSNGDSEIGFMNVLSSYQKEIEKQLKIRNLRFHHLSDDLPVVLVGKDHPLYALGDFATVTPQMLAGYPLVRYSTMDYSHYGDKAYLVGIKKYAGEIIVASRSALHEMLENTQAFAVVSYNQKLYRHVDYYSDTHRLFIEGCTLIHRFGRVVREDAVLSPLAVRFVQLMDSYLE